jgi:hypothetical protein
MPGLQIRTAWRTTCSSQAILDNLARYRTVGKVTNSPAPLHFLVKLASPPRHFVVRVFTIFLPWSEAVLRQAIISLSNE